MLARISSCKNGHATMIALSRASTRAANNAGLRNWQWLLCRGALFFGGISTPECANDGITRRASHYIISVVFCKTLSRCTVFYSENLCDGENSTCHELRQYALYPTRVWAIFMRLPLLLLRTPDLMQRWNDPNCIRIVLEHKYSWVKPHSECVALRVPSLSLFHEYTTRVTRNPPGIFKTLPPWSTPSFLGPDLCFGKPQT